MKILDKLITRFEFKLRCVIPSRLIARINGVKVVANSIPKSGTHLQIRCLSLFPNLTYTGTIFSRGLLECDELEKVFKKTGKGRFTAAHLWWRKEYASYFKENSFKTILLIRDPRDIVVSEAYYVISRKSHRLYEYFSSLGGINNCIAECIRGVNSSEYPKKVMVSIRERFSNFTPWIKEPNNLLIRFEDLIGESGGGSRLKQIEQIRRIARHIDFDISKKQVENIMCNMKSKRTSTFRKGVIGDWKCYFDKNLKNLFKDVAGPLLIDNGYEKDNNW